MAFHGDAMELIMELGLLDDQLSPPMDLPSQRACDALETRIHAAKVSQLASPSPLTDA